MKTPSLAERANLLAKHATRSERDATARRIGNNHEGSIPFTRSTFRMEFGGRIAFATPPQRRALMVSRREGHARVVFDHRITSAPQ
jgi:hypothetical protein